MVPAMRCQFLGALLIFGVISGLIWDDRGAQLSDARVEIEGSTLKETTKSGGVGFFHFAQIPPGEYTMIVSHPDFATVEQKVVVRKGETTTIGVQLRERRKKR